MLLIMLLYSADIAAVWIRRHTYTTLTHTILYMYYTILFYMY